MAEPRDHSLPNRSVAGNLAKVVAKKEKVNQLTAKMLPACISPSSTLSQSERLFTLNYVVSIFFWMIVIIRRAIASYEKILAISKGLPGGGCWMQAASFALVVKKRHSLSQ